MSSASAAAVSHAADESSSTGVLRWAFNAVGWEPTEEVRFDCSSKQHFTVTIAAVKTHVHAAELNMGRLHFV